MEIILDMSKELGKSFNTSYNNYLIGKIVFKKYIESNNLSYVFMEENKRRGYKKSLLKGLKEEQLCYLLEITLLKNKKNKEGHLNNPINWKGKSEFFKVISKNEIEEFMILTKDFNKIHKGKRPVAQGLLILLYIDNYLKEKMYKYSEIEIKFIAPIYPDEELKISINGDEILLLINSKIVLKGRIKWKQKEE